MKNLNKNEKYWKKYLLYREITETKTEINIKPEIKLVQNVKYHNTI